MNGLKVIARVANQLIAFEADAVESVTDLGHIVPVPLAPVHVAGLAAARSRVLTVIDLSKALGFSKPAESNRAVVVSHDAQVFALQVDQVIDVAISRPIGLGIHAGAGGPWQAAAVETVECEAGLALVMNVRKLIEGPVGNAALPINSPDTLAP